MGRVIKFRYVYSDGKASFTKEFTLGQVEAGDPWEEISDSPLMRDYRITERLEFTGLTDKAGKDIFESDLVYVAGVGNMEVKWDVCGYWSFMPGCLDYQDVIEDLERVVGNIYENSNLMEGDV